MYFITGMTNVRKEHDKPNTKKWNEHSTRAYGYVKDEKTARKVVEQNMADIFETCYYYVVIEYIPDGLYALAEEIAWYKYVVGEDRYEEIGKPKGTEMFNGYAIG